LTYPTPLNLTVTIAGTEVQDYILQSEENYIRSIIGSRMDSLRLTLKTPPISIAEWDEIIVTNGSTRLFAGYIQEIIIKQLGLAELSYRIMASDYAALLTKVYAREEYTDKSDAYILNDLFVNYLPEVNASNYVDEIKTYPRIRFNRMSLYDVIDRLATSAGADWYLDYDKNLHFYLSETNAAPFNLSSSYDLSATYPFKKLQKVIDGMDLVNRVTVVGGTYLGNDEEIIISGGGESPQLPLPAKIHEPTGSTSIYVLRNDGGTTTNYIVNPSFETNITDGWTQSQSGSLGSYSRHTLDYYSGAASLRIAAGTDDCALQSGSIAIDPDGNITAQCRAKVGTVGIAQLNIYDITNGTIRAYQTNRDTDIWEKLTASWNNTTDGTVQVRIDLINNAGDYNSQSGPTSAFFDAVQAEKQGWPSDYCDGSLGDSYAWSGTANNSSSTRKPINIWTPMTVKAGYINSLSSETDLLFYYQEEYLQQENNWPGLDNAVKISARYDLPVYKRITDSVSYATYGRYFDQLINDPKIMSQEEAYYIARARLDEYANGINSYSCVVMEPGLLAGQTIHLYDELQGIDEDFVIQSITTYINALTYMEADVELGALSPDLVDALNKIAKLNEPEIPWDIDEVLDEILNASSTMIALSDSPSGASLSWAPYVWDTARWSKCTWS